MTDPENLRPIEQGIELDLRDRVSYGDYLRLDALLSAQQPLSDPPHHDEMLFIIQHQVAGALDEADDPRAARGDRAICAPTTSSPALKILARVKQIQRQLFEQWAVLETLTPSEYVEFRAGARRVVGIPVAAVPRARVPARQQERGHARRVRPRSRPRRRELRAMLDAPSLYDEFLRYLARRGHAVPARSAASATVSQPYVRDAGARCRCSSASTRTPKRLLAAYDLCEKLVDVEESFQLWRFRHMKTVERIIGFKRGTGGSSGVAFLSRRWS